MHFSSTQLPTPTFHDCQDAAVVLLSSCQIHYFNLRSVYANLIWLEFSVLAIARIACYISNIWYYILLSSLVCVSLSKQGCLLVCRATLCSSGHP
jgi:hypothetical protein